MYRLLFWAQKRDKKLDNGNSRLWCHVRSIRIRCLLVLNRRNVAKKYSETLAIFYRDPGISRLERNNTKFSRRTLVKTFDEFQMVGFKLGSQTLHTTVTSFFRSLHTKGINCHFIPVTSYQVTSYKAILHTSHFIPSHFIPKSLHTNALHIRALHTDIGKVNKI